FCWTDCYSLIRKDTWSALLVHCDVGKYRFRHLYAYFITALAQASLGIYGNIHGNGCAAGFYDIGIETHYVPDKHRLLEHERIYRHGGYPPACPADCRETARDIHLRHDPSAEYIACIVGVRRHGHQPQYRIVFR